MFTAFFVQAHDAAVSRLSWAHPEFGTILASASFDRTVKIWERASFAAGGDVQSNGSVHAQTAVSGSSSSSRWVERTVLLDARGTVRAVEFAPHHFGLKLVCINVNATLSLSQPWSGNRLV